MLKRHYGWSHCLSVSIFHIVHLSCLKQASLEAKASSSLRLSNLQGHGLACCLDRLQVFCCLIIFLLGMPLHAFLCFCSHVGVPAQDCARSMLSLNIHADTCTLVHVS